MSYYFFSLSRRGVFVVFSFVRVTPRHLGDSIFNNNRHVRGVFIAFRIRIYPSNANVKRSHQLCGGRGRAVAAGHRCCQSMRCCYSRSEPRPSSPDNNQVRIGAKTFRVPSRAALPCNRFSRGQRACVCVRVCKCVCCVYLPVALFVRRVHHSAGGRGFFL